MSDYDDPSEDGPFVIHVVVGDPDRRTLPTIVEMAASQGRHAIKELESVVDSLEFSGDEKHMNLMLAFDRALQYVRTAVSMADKS